MAAAIPIYASGRCNNLPRRLHVARAGDGRYRRHMLYAPLLRRRVVALWEQLTPAGIEGLPLADDVRFSYPGDHAMAIEATSADELRGWLQAL